MGVSNELINLCKKQDRKAQFELYRECYKFLMQVCLRYEKNEDDAHVVLNLSFLKILNNLKRYQSKVPFEAWCKRITINTIIDEFRKNKKYKGHLQMGDVEGDWELERYVLNEAELSLTAEDMEKMLQSLSPLNRKIFNLHVIDGYSHKEIGKMLDISDGTSKWHVNKARNSLKHVLRQTFMKIKTVML